MNSAIKIPILDSGLPLYTTLTNYNIIRYEYNNVKAYNTTVY
jgi:hypothetical protein